MPVKYSYPPKPLPETTGTLSTIPITKGEQIIVTSNPSLHNISAVTSTSLAPPASTSRSEQPPTPAPSVKAFNDAISAPTPIVQPQRRPDSPLAQNDIPVESSESVALPGRDAGYLQLRVVPDDNSCLFSAVGVVFEGEIEAAQRLRKVVADAIRNDPFTYSDVMLGQPADQYIEKIVKPETWGGAIAELSIFSKHYKTEISSFDVATGRCDRFGQDEYDSRCLLVYSGIHYDALTLSPLPVSPPSFHTTVFPVTDSTILPTAEKLISQLKARHYYTDTATFDLRCQICGTGLKGEKGAREHASQTGHVQFGEY
ncbi:ubiquitin thioesterase OTU1 [Kwoniella heveanensis BCC8398]|uniref:Ubiquitin thioesterase OTU n=1 Tax=Kwoniella heveanensis BCC8398 TaxID=1296120 RepID=A0A1B9GVP9_9TREE|nr:ubiquitin thioesterase OTU1 [Kwoniella heveanensis BCC8398]